MTIAVQISRFGTGVDDFVRCVRWLDEDLFLQRLGGWTPRDILAHLIGWNRYVIEGCRQISRGELPFYDIDPGDNYSKVNGRLVREYSSSNKSKLLEELAKSVQELKKFLESLDPEIWDRDFGVKNEGSTITIRTTVDELIDDYTHHTKQLEEWSARD